MRVQERIFIMKSNILVSLKGMLVGGTMLVPGVSGGSMAMILGIYRDLVHAIGSFTKQKKHNFIFLFLFCIGSVIGMVTFAKPLLKALETYPMPMSYFFMGAVAGGVPLIVKEANQEKTNGNSIGWLLLGVLIVSIFALLPTGLIQAQKGWMGIFVLIIAGFISAIALILPGISVSYMFLLLGIYDSTMEAIGAMNLIYLMPLVLGVLVGIILTTRILEYAMERYRRQTYFTILGFVLASVAELFPGIPDMGQWLVCIPMLILGYVIIQWLAKYQTEE